MKTSVALCTYNGEKYIEEQIQSILNQTIVPDEIIICDDQSTDNTINIIEGFKNPSIKLYRNEENLGVIKNFEKALRLCSGEIIFLSDQDDIWYPNKVETIIKFFNDTKYKGVFHNLQLLNNPNNIWSTLLFDEMIREYVFDNDMFTEYLLKYYNVVTGAALAIKKEVLNDILPLNNKYPYFLHDYEIALKLSLKNEIIALNQTLGIYRLHENQQVGVKLMINESKQKSIQGYITGVKDWEAEFEYLFIALNRTKMFISIIPELIKYVEIFENRINDAKKQFFVQIPFIRKKIQLLRWYKNKKYNISLFDVFSK